MALFSRAVMVRKGQLVNQRLRLGRKRLIAFGPSVFCGSRQSTINLTLTASLNSPVPIANV